MHRLIYRCGKCRKLQVNTFLGGCIKCRYKTFDVMFRDDMRKMAMMIVEG